MRGGGKEVEEKEMKWLKWRLCYVKNGVCVFVDELSLADGADWHKKTARNVSWPEPTDYYQQRLLGFVMEKVTTDVFGRDSMFNEWCHYKVVQDNLPAFVIIDDYGQDVVKYGDEAHTVMEIFSFHEIPCGWLE